MKQWIPGSVELFPSGPASEPEPAEGEHLLRPAHLGLGGMRQLYDKLGLLATSTNADIVLIRSHLAYHGGARAAERATIRPSRGHTYRIDGMHGENNVIVKIVDYSDHRAGVIGWTR